MNVASFRDATGREWWVEIPNFGTVADLREKTAFDLNKLAHSAEALIDFVYDDAERLLDVVRHMISGQHPEVSDKAFLESIDSASLEAIKLAVVEAAIGFFHGARAGKMLQASRSILATLAGLSGSAGGSPASPD